MWNTRTNLATLLRDPFLVHCPMKRTREYSMGKTAGPRVSIQLSFSRLSAFLRCSSGAVKTVIPTAKHSLPRHCYLRTLRRPFQKVKWRMSVQGFKSPTCPWNLSTIAHTRSVNTSRRTRDSPIHTWRPTLKPRPGRNKGQRKTPEQKKQAGRSL